MRKQKTGKKQLSEDDEKAAQRAYAIFLDRRKEAKIAEKLFLQNNPCIRLPEELNFCQRTVAKRVGWTQGNLSQYLSGAVPIREAALEKICKALECQPWEIRPEKYLTPNGPIDSSVVDKMALELLNSMIGKIASGVPIENLPVKPQSVLRNFIESEVESRCRKFRQEAPEPEINSDAKLQLTELLSDYSEFKNNITEFEERLDKIREKIVSFS